MKKVYLVIREHELTGTKEKYTDIIHICNDVDLAVEYANTYIQDSIKDLLAAPHKYPVWTMSKYFEKEYLISGRGCCYISFEDNDSIVEMYSLKIEEHELKED